MRQVAVAALFIVCLGLASGSDLCSTEGAETTRGNRLCTCEYPQILGQWGDQTEWICRLNGCEDWNEALGKNVFYKPGATMRLQGSKCQCVKGTDPNLMDARTLYHIRCRDD